MAQTASVPTYWSSFSINNLLSSFRNVIYMIFAKLFIEVNSYFLNSFPKHIRVLCSIFIMPCALGHCHAKNLASISWSFKGYTTPGHQFASFMLDYKIQVMMLKKVTWPFPIVITTIKALYVDLGFIKVHCLLSVNHCQILMFLIPF
ncbi:hypothetical protein RO3G_10559 [Rhizopus delemar RA 99-880]|uniref:Uncharacterized protein n=1 Tax=Rhizopus delemar (strain RA 99-880 / ATCC MYA-4621 / FGSC 9543 / NRRL 43880) TaxID=246409 RepID=I1CBL3_RHIO9|nr:hypothetical protein RO3G_10553 [Rhizopus delemar RA 99-880]EIE85849.1 hypothetical protein RO3G_10559 [Rhizopus delemar RA 99-880]|eukprot:EIE85843.1 hypothetical protein RO3G_10553 [Rhizopus delemar RA 99-880]